MLAPLLPVVLYVIFVIGKLIHLVWASVPDAELNATVLLGLMVTDVVVVLVHVPFVNE